MTEKKKDAGTMTPMKALRHRKDERENRIQMTTEPTSGQTRLVLRTFVAAFVASRAEFDRSDLTHAVRAAFGYVVTARDIEHELNRLRSMRVIRNKVTCLWVDGIPNVFEKISGEPNAE